MHAVAATGHATGFAITKSRSREAAKRSIHCELRVFPPSRLRPARATIVIIADSVTVKVDE